ncbi:hypothetical protein E2C01_062539 [Portunus trituberculatus]|uniref:Uncharacterized protein n=1 Tax=Portunus trituberculatus TaxID=210409 RepID=A0A5B7HEY9_PORTR|nr:hypothetical protein [Portunus trituberculatus]
MTSFLCGAVSQELPGVTVQSPRQLEKILDRFKCLCFLSELDIRQMYGTCFSPGRECRAGRGRAAGGKASPIGQQHGMSNKRRWRPMD